MVVSGELDLGMIPTRAWDTEGVTSLRAIQAPFLITSNDMISGVVTSDLADDMLAGLDQAGVVGLALVPEGLREVFSFGEPLLTPDEFSGLVVRAPTSDTTRLLFDALGATVGPYGGYTFATGVQAGTIGAAESSFELADGLPSVAIAIGDLPLFPKVNSLVVNDAAFADMTDEQQGILRAAALATRDHAIGAMTDPAVAAARYCSTGGTVVVTGADNAATFRAAAEPVYAQLESDASTKSFIDRLRELTSGARAPASVTACAPAAPTTAPPTSGAAMEFPEGVYRTEMSTEQLLAAGIASGTAGAQDGINTFTFQDGQFTHEIQRVPRDLCHGTYTVESGRLVVSMNDCGVDGVLFSATWALDGTTLRFDNVQGRDVAVQALWGDRDWTKIAGSDDMTQEFPEGLYRAEMSTTALLAAGLPSGTANAGEGVHTLTFQHGQFMHEIKRNPPDQCRGSYTVESGRVVVRMTECDGGGRIFFSAGWTLDGTTLTLLDLHSETDSDAFVNALWGNRAWERIG
jgi:TRAP-type C4-dicarboxylate transport system substrate-binding protein